MNVRRSFFLRSLLLLLIFPCALCLLTHLNVLFSFHCVHFGSSSIIIVFLLEKSLHIRVMYVNECASASVIVHMLRNEYKRTAHIQKRTLNLARH